MTLPLTLDTPQRRIADEARATQAARHDILSSFGVEYYQANASAITGARENDLYVYKAFVGPHTISVETGDSVFWIDASLTSAQAMRGPYICVSDHMAVMLRGYTTRNRSCEIDGTTVLPYVNGCSTRQILPPERLGDPTVQLLKIPPYTSEQAHHIHSTARVVFILEGQGHCVVGMDQWHARQELSAGMVVVLHPMCPHHFETQHSALVVMPIHIYSSVPGGMEFAHPMFNGTHKV